MGDLQGKKKRKLISTDHDSQQKRQRTGSSSDSTYPVKQHVKLKKNKGKHKLHKSDILTDNTHSNSEKCIPNIVQKSLNQTDGSQIQRNTETAIKLKAKHKKKIQKKVKAKTGDSTLKTDKQKLQRKKLNWRKREKLRIQKAKTKSGENVSEKWTGIVKLPSQPGEFDNNWKNLMKKLEKSPKSPKLVHKRSQPQKSAQPAEHHKRTEDTPEIWFDDVDELLLDKKGKPNAASMPSSEQKEKQLPVNPLVKPQSFEGITKVVAMDCEMVGVGEGGQDSILARASIVNQFGRCIYDKYVKPKETVTDYRTHVSGILPEHLKKGEPFEKVCKEIYEIIKGRLLVGHAIHNDLKVLFLDHPHKKIRDTQLYKPFRQLFQGRRPALKKLTEKVLGVKVQEGQHDSIQDAQAAMRLYTMHRQAWEKSIKEKFMKPKKIPSVVNLENDH